MAIETKPKCYRCRDKGEVGGCPKCGKIKGKADKVVKEQLIKQDYDKMYIPKDYKGKVWRREVLDASKAELCREKKYLAFTEQLEKIHSMFLNGQVVNKSAIIVAPRTFSKMTWAYSCMQLAYKHGYKIFPIMDTAQMKRFVTIELERPNNNSFDIFKYKYEDLLMADVVFMTVSHGVSRYSAYETIDNIIDERSRMDKPTIVLSRYSCSEFCRFDTYKRFSSIIDKSGKEIGKRYPVFVQYTDNTMNAVL